ncbi:LysR family transcriptional regulator [Geosporobacter ferrireducens]|uniref:LysR family transcriptional regulator n=1 Tax=Geosporobacter ferrireducens TaxID=1424294 RepID=UPI00139CD09E|nr:LysR family transcriptional regulator [Geosporobacter ferrireducens]MTI57463.1 LysR family transcriptional regulator [Geosporobacter ferrireducens]
MELRQLKTFCAIAETGSFTKAAEALGYAQSSITAQIQSLEEELETKLFERLGRNILLSKSGKRLLVYARQIINLSSEAKEVIKGSSTKGTLTISAPESLCVYRLPKILAAYRNRYPDVEIVVRTGACTEMLSWLKNDDIDISFMIGRKLSYPYLITESLISEPIVILSEPGHPLAEKDAVTPEDMNGEHLILTDKGLANSCYRVVFEEMINKAGVQPKAILEYGSVEAIKKCVIGGLGITALPFITVQEEVKRKELAVLRWVGQDFDIATQIVYHKNKWLSPPMLAFIDVVRESLASPEAECRCEMPLEPLAWGEFSSTQEMVKG